MWSDEYYHLIRLICCQVEARGLAVNSPDHVIFMEQLLQTIHDK